MSQRGWLTKQKRKKDGRVWIFHWYRVRPSDGKHVENTVVVGRVASFPKESNAWGGSGTSEPEPQYQRAGLPDGVRHFWRTGSKLRTTRSAEARRHNSVHCPPHS